MWEDEAHSTGGGTAAPKFSARRSSFKVGDVVGGIVLSVRPHRALVELGDRTVGTLADKNISHATGAPVNIETVMRASDRVLAMVIKNPSEHSLELSTKELEPTPGDILRNPQLLFYKAEEMAGVWRKRGEAAWITAEIGDCKTTQQLVSLVEQHGRAFNTSHAVAALSLAAGILASVPLHTGAAPLAPVEEVVGLARVRATFALSTRSGKIAGGIAGVVVERLEPAGASGRDEGFPQADGLVLGAAFYRVVRGGEVVFKGPCTSLKRDRLDVQSVPPGAECGVVLGGGEFASYRAGDVIECVRSVTKKPEAVGSAAAMPRGSVEHMLQLAREQLPQMAATDLVRMLNGLANLGLADNGGAFLAALLEAAVPRLHEFSARQLAQFNKALAKLGPADDAAVMAALWQLEAAQEAVQEAAHQRELEASVPTLSARRPSFKVGDVVQGTVVELRRRRAHVELGDGTIGWLRDKHISHGTGELISMNKLKRVGDRMLAMVIKNAKRGSMWLSTEELEPTPGDMLHGPQLLFDKAEEMADVWRQRGQAAWVRAEISDCKTTEQLVSLVEQHGRAFDPSHAEYALIWAAKLGAEAMPRGIIEQMLQLAREQLPQMAASDLVRMLNVLTKLGPADNKHAFVAALSEAAATKLHKLLPAQLATVLKALAELGQADAAVTAGSRKLEKAVQEAQEAAETVQKAAQGAQQAAREAIRQRKLEKAAQAARSATKSAALASYRVGDVVEGTVESVRSLGAFLVLGNDIRGLLQVSDVSHGRLLRTAANAAACGGHHIGDVIRPGDLLRAMVLHVSVERQRLTLSTKTLEPSPGDMSHALNHQPGTFSHPIHFQPTIMASAVTAAFAQLSTADASEGVVAAVKKAGTSSMAPVAESVTAGLAGDAVSKENALKVVAALVAEFGKASEPYLVSLIPAMLSAAADKAAPVREAATAAMQALFAVLNPYSTDQVMEMLFAAMEQSRNWQCKVLALHSLANLAATAPNQIAAALSDIVPRLTDTMSDAKAQVKEATEVALKETFAVNGNRDIAKFLPVLIGCIRDPTQTTDCIHQLAATTFVQQVEGPPLSLLVPLLMRGLRERATAIKRKSAVIIDNMAKLVENPHDAAPFLPKLLPELEKVSDDVADPECRKVATGAKATLLRVGGEGKLSAPKKAELEVMTKRITDALGAKASSVDAASTKYSATAMCCMVDLKHYVPSFWSENLVPYLKGAGEAEARAAVTKCLDLAKADADKEAALIEAEEQDEGEDLCNCEFSLAYGAKILLNMAKLRLKKGKRYGLCGPNGCGKSTLMRAIANGQVEGFPPPTELRTVYVEHDIDSEDADIPSLDFVANDKRIAGQSKDEVEKMLKSVGFSDEYLQKPVGALSGGWKMKLALARAILMKAQILLLDEPTNHLDVTNVRWLEDYLNALTEVTCIMVSHDAGFLDRACTNILNYESRKLKSYKGNLSEFVKQKPEAMAYYQLSAAAFSFKFPEPGYLEGVKTKDKAILKMIKCDYTYPGTDKCVVSDISLYCTLSSRVVVHGANGAGKSTMIKMLCAENEPTAGTVWRHPNLRIAYVAQHAFHHIEHHLEKTPNQYIQWRYAIGEDREALTKVDRKLSPEEEKAMLQIIMVDGEKRLLEKLCSRRKFKSSYEYECQWIKCDPTKNSYLSRDELIQLGFEKLCNELDAKEAAAAGLYAKPLTAVNISKHLEEFGLDTEFSTHSLMRGLSGGQKVKVVLGAAMWNNPHMLVLDEPTNYLDRDSLGALAEAVKGFGGGVIMITHNVEFSGAICSETWSVAGGKLTRTGELAGGGVKEKVEFKQEEEMLDAFGNVMKVKAQAKLKVSNKEKKALKKLRDARRARGEDVKAQAKLKVSNKEKKALKKLRDARRARGEDVTDSEKEL
ncbi:hypothetical protein FOA52_014214 [Chlamydomonas sp. UWO 241]|nr:hypothetical protein FOA52_014214 [Chlamydomonas sp. UWO 241]